MKQTHAIRIAAFAVVGIFFAWVLARLDWHEFGQRVAGASIADLAMMLVLWMSVLLLRPVRFRFLLHVLGHVEGADYRTIWASMVLGAAVNSFAPMRAGDVVLAVFLRQRLGVGMHQSFTVIIADWACDLVCVAIIFFGALAFAPAIAAWTDHAIVTLIALLLVGLAGAWAVLHWRTWVLVLLDRVLTRLVPRWQQRAMANAEEILAGLAAISTWKTALPLVLISLLIWGLAGLSYWFGLRAVFPDASVAGAVFNMASVTLSFVVPLGSGGMGAFEAASVLALAVFGVPLEAAIAFAVIAHMLQLGSVLLFTALAVLTRQIDYKSLRSGAQKREP